MKSDWNSIDTIPTDRDVWVETASGKQYLARARRMSKDDPRPFIRPGKGVYPRTVACWRKDLPGGGSGDVAATAWRDVLTREEK